MAEFPDIPKMVARISNVRLRGGVVGKVSTVLIAVCIAMAVISWSVRLWWISLIAILAIVALCFPLLWRLVTFAERNPYAALFEGAELLAHERLKFGTKETPTLPTTPQQQPIIELEDQHTEETESNSDG